MSKIYLDYKEMLARDKTNDDKYDKFRNLIFDEIVFDKLRSDIKNSLVHKNGIKIDNGMYLTFRKNNEELRVYCYYDDIVITESQRAAMVNESKRSGKKLPKMQFYPTDRFRLVYVQGIDGKRPDNVTTIKFSEAKQIMSHPFFRKNFT